MKTLQAQRDRYLKMIEAAGNPEILESVERLEHETNQIDVKKCKLEFARQYIRTGSLSYDYYTVHCTTVQVQGYEKDQARIKEYFEQRNPHAFVLCNSDTKCQAYLKPESLFEEKK